MNEHYDQEFFADQAGGSIVAAQTILPIVWTIAQPRGVVDLGCGVGAWLRVASDLGAADIVGLDGALAARSNLRIPADRFRVVDFESELPDLGQRFDLAICVEVVEHVSPIAGENAVAWLCRHGRMVLFSAAIPFQGGTGHQNESWQSNWAERFQRHGYRIYDLIRPRIWSDQKIPFWYRQNLFIAAEQNHPILRDFQPALNGFLDVVHPELFLSRMKRYTRLDRRTLRGRLRTIRSIFAGRRVD
jgi:SAM-dependent methyltransferase